MPLHHSTPRALVAQGSEVMTTIGDITIVANAVSRMNYSIPHLISASRFSREVKAVEAANEGRPFGPWWEDMRHNAVSCLFVISAAMESYANELFSDRKDVFSGAPALLIDKIWDMSERKSPIEKLDLILHLREKPALDKKAAYYKAMIAVIRLRNELTHFKPEWSHEADIHIKISDVLKGYFIRSPHFANELIFPSAWVGHSCTSWAVKTTLDFIREFEALAAINDRENLVQFRESLQY
jgi:hypothetical protein